MKNLDPLDVRKVRTFLAVVEAGSLRLAAKTLHRSQPAVTLTIRALEDDLAKKLFRKVGQRKRLTPFGEAFLRVVKPAYEAWLTVNDELASTADGGVRGTVRLGAGEAACLYILPDVLRTFRREYPDVEVLLLNQPKAETVRMLESGELDLGVRTASRLPRAIASVPCVASRRVVIAPRGLTLRRRPSIDDLAAHPFVAPPAGSDSRTIIERAFRRAGARLRVAVEAGGWEVIKAAVRSDLGIAIVPTLCLNPADHRALIVRPADPQSFPPESYQLLYREDRPMTPAARTLLGLLERPTKQR